MPRIITPEINKELKKEYRYRFFALLFFMLSLVGMLHVAFTYSSYVLLKSYEEIALQNLENNNKELVKQNKDYLYKTNQTFLLTQKTALSHNVYGFTIFEKIKKYANEQIVISVFETYADKDNIMITIRGTSPTREALINFNEDMKSDNSFSDFNIPLDILTRQRDITFDVTFKYNEN